MTRTADGLPPALPYELLLPGSRFRQPVSQFIFTCFTSKAANSIMLPHRSSYELDVGRNGIAFKVHFHSGLARQKRCFFFSALKDNDHIEWSNKLCVLNKRRCCTVSRSVRDRQRDGKSWINGGGPVQNSFFSPVCYAFQNTRNTLRLGKHSLFKVSSSSNQKVIWYNQKRHCKIRKL